MKNGKIIKSLQAIITTHIIWKNDIEIIIQHNRSRWKIFLSMFDFLKVLHYGQYFHKEEIYVL